MIDNKHVQDNNLIPYREILPVNFAGYLDEIHDATGFDRNYLFASMLSAFACAMQKKFVVQANTYRQFPALYLCLVGISGKGKTPPLKALYKVLDDYNAKLWNEYVKQKRQIEKEIAEAKNAKQEIHLELPRNPKFLISDTTIEKLLALMHSNAGYQTLMMNELSSLLDNTNRYKSNSEAFYLSAYDQMNYSYDRKSEDGFIIKDAVLNLAGTIQTGLLNKFKQNNRAESGLLYRFLFVFPESDFLETDAHLIPKEGRPNPFGGWNKSVMRVLNLSPEIDFNNEIQPRIVRLSDEASLMLTDWIKDNKTALNEKIASCENVDAESGFVSKSLYTVLRIALILETMRNVECLDQPFSISGESALGAMKATDAFTNTGVYVYNKTQDQDTVRGKEAKSISILDHLEIGTPYHMSELLLKLTGKGMKKSTFYNIINDLEKSGYIQRGHREITRVK